MRSKRILQIIVPLLILLFCSCSFLVSKMAFFPVKDEVIDPRDLPGNFREVVIKTEDNKNLYCLLSTDTVERKIAVYFHGNAENVYQSLPVLQNIYRCNLHVLGVDYRGYGKSTGRPSENGIYKDGIAAIRYVLDSLHYNEEEIVIIGRSIGSTTACNAAAQFNRIDKLVLISPFSSGVDYISYHGLRFLSPFARKIFDNVEKIKKVQCPVLVIAGTSDQTTPFQMAQKVYDAVQYNKFFFKISTAGHNDIFFIGSDSLWNAIAIFAEK